MNNKFIDDILEFLIENTVVKRYEKLPDVNFHYTGYLIVPIGNGFRFDVSYKTILPNGDFTNEWWTEMKEIYTLKDKEVMYVLDEYNDFLWYMVEKINLKEEIKSEINETKEPPSFNFVTNQYENIDKKFLDKVVGVLKDETDYNSNNNNLTIPISPYTLNKLTNYGHPLTGGFHSFKPYAHFYDEMQDKFGIGNYAEIQYIYHKYKKYILELINTEI